jgi:hypothetical protein
MAIATSKQAREIVIMNAFGAPARHVAEYLSENQIDGVYGYHVTPAENTENILANGLQTHSCYNRNDAVYLFLDSDETPYNAPILVGDGDYTVVKVLIPSDVAATIKDDGFYKANFYNSGSACYIERQIPAEWIVK